MNRFWIFIPVAITTAASFLYAAVESPAQNYMPPAKDIPTGPRYSSGPCMVVATGLTRSAILTDPEHLDDCVLRLRLFVDPRLSAIGFAGRFVPDTAVDESGTSLVGAESKTSELGVATFTQYVPRIETFKRIQPNTALESDVALHIPDNAGKKIALVKGNVHLKILGKTTVVDIPLAEFGTVHNIDFHGAKIAIAAVRNLRQEPDKEYSTSINVTRPGMANEQWNEVNDLLDGVTLSILDDKGVAWTQGGGGWEEGRTSPSRSISAQFRLDNFGPANTPKPGPAATFRLILPEEIKDMPIPFEFKDLPIP